MPSTPSYASPERLRRARHEKGLTQEQVGERAGLTYNTISRYETGAVVPPQANLTLLSFIYEKPVSWFFADEVAPESDTQKPSSDPGGDGDVPHWVRVLREEIAQCYEASQTALSDAIGRLSSSRTPAAALSPVEVLEVATAAGGGAQVYDETVVGRIWFRHGWLEHNAIDPQQCNIITVRGESMEPTLADGCSILVDRSRRALREGHIYVMRTEDGLVVKRAGRDEFGRWLIVSDHPAWNTVPWPADAEVIGEVRWMARTL